MASDQQIIDLVRKAFGTEPRPEHFTNYVHCCECVEHDKVLCSRDVTSLKVKDVNTAAWDPICFLTTEGFQYYLPALVRLALESSTSQDSWYLPQLLFHLIGDGPQNRRVVCCTASQQQTITAFLWHVVDTRNDLIVCYGVEAEIQRAIEIWSPTKECIS